MQGEPTFGLNRITVPHTDLASFFSLAARLGCDAVELRNDLGKTGVTEGLTERRVLDLQDRYGIRIASINALQRFNDGPALLAERAAELAELVRTAAGIRAGAVVLCPVNDESDGRTEKQCADDTVRALRAFGPLLRDSGILGLVEPLGFTFCSLRRKKDAILAMEDSGFGSCYRLVHDTFHHYLSGETQFYPERTAIVHVSSVAVGTPRPAIVDGCRLLPAVSDELKSPEQVRSLVAGGFCGCISVESFSAEVQSLPSGRLETELRSALAALAGF